jgi:hypothetical protein
MISEYQAYIDDSGKGQEPVFVLAGFVAPTAAWASFSDEWAGALRGPPSLAYFKMKEAAACRGQFVDWRDAARDNFLRRLIGIIDRHVTVGIGSVIPQKAYKEVFQGRIAPGADTPYF